MRRVAVYLAVVVVAVALVFVLRARKRAFVAQQVRLLQSDDRQMAERARKALQRIGRSAVRPVCALLEQEGEDVRARAAVTLANIGHPAACGPLMAAARRGEFPAADALAFVKHPKAAEAQAWAYCRLGDKVLEEFSFRSPVGGRPPTAACVAWAGGPRAPFRPPLRQAIEWPTSVYESRAYGYLALYGPPSVAEPYKEAMQHCRLPEAIMGQARVLELCGQYGSAAHYYGQALSANPGDEAARTAKTEAEERAALARRMEKLLPQGYRVHRILGDPTWRDGRMTYLVGVANQAPPQLEMGIGAGRLALFGREGDQLRKLAVTPVFSHRELTTAGYDPTAHVAAFTPQPGQRAMLAVIRAGLGGTLVWPNWWWRASPWWHPGLCYDMVLYSVERGHLAKTLQARSAAMPWVGDLDGDEDIEMVTWQEVSRELQQPDRVPWPIVRTLVKGRYEVRTEEFPMLFEPVPRVLAKRKHRYRSDPKLADHLGRAFEILGRREEAAAAYELAEQKYRATAERKAKKGEADQARLHTLAAEAVKHRRVRLEREGGS